MKKKIFISITRFVCINYLLFYVLSYARENTFSFIVTLLLIVLNLIAFNMEE